MKEELRTQTQHDTSTPGILFGSGFLEKYVFGNRRSEIGSHETT